VFHYISTAGFDFHVIIAENFTQISCNTAYKLTGNWWIYIGMRETELDISFPSPTLYLEFNEFKETLVV